jgi:hypothetical protein
LVATTSSALSSELTEQGTAATASTALTPLSLATAPYGTVRRIAGYDTGGNAGLVGTTYNVNIRGLYGTPVAEGLEALGGALKAEAAQAGAESISILGTQIMNPAAIADRY